jgi:hypothetical protein
MSILYTFFIPVANYPEEIEAQIARNQDLTSEKVAKRFPFLARKPAAE